MTTTAEPNARTSTARTQADALIDSVRTQLGELIDAANRTEDTAAAEGLAQAGVAAFEDLGAFSAALDDAIAATEAPALDITATIDLDQLHQAFVRKHPQAFTVTFPYQATPPMQQWTCGDTFTELAGGVPRILPVRPEATGGDGDLTWSDYFAGAGGSSSGIMAVPGAHVQMAVNHWPLAIETHNYNHPNTDHDVASLARTDPSRYASTDFGWFSPECTYWSVARGDKCDYDEAAEQLTLDVLDEEMDTPEAREAKWRSRMLMRDVVRFSRYHRYKAVIVENVPDILKWAAMDRWLAEMVAEGYRYKIITLNSAFAQGSGMPAPQLRDRVYVVFWLAKYRTPNWNKWLRPQALCPSCGETVRALYNPKPGKRRPMRYKAQYTYRCPKTTCRGADVQPLVLPAAAAIDLNDLGERIGDRKRPLAKKTRDRIAAGLKIHCRPVVVETSGHTFERRPGVRTWPVDRPLGTQHTTASKSLAASPGMVVPTGGTWNDDAYSVNSPLRTRTTRESEALVMPLEGRGPISSIRRVHEPFRTQSTRHQDALIVPLRNNGNSAPVSTPLRTFAAGGQHHALVTPEQAALYSYDSGQLRPLDMPMTTQTTVEGDALIGGEFVDVDDCTLRMLSVAEIQAGMAFAGRYVLLGKAKRDKVRMLGNAVTPPASRDLAACVMEAVTGVDIPLFELPVGSH